MLHNKQFHHNTYPLNKTSTTLQFIIQQPRVVATIPFVIGHGNWPLQIPLHEIGSPFPLLIKCNIGGDLCPKYLL